MLCLILLSAYVGVYYMLSYCQMNPEEGVRSHGTEIRDSFSQSFELPLGSFAETAGSLDH